MSQSVRLDERYSAHAAFWDSVAVTVLWITVITVIRKTAGCSLVGAHQRYNDSSAGLHAHGAGRLRLLSVLLWTMPACVWA